MLISQPLQNCGVFGHEGILEIILLHYSIFLRREGETYIFSDLLNVTSLLARPEPGS